MQQYLHRIATCKNRLSSYETVCFFQRRGATARPRGFFGTFSSGPKTPRGQRMCVVPAAEFHPVLGQKKRRRMAPLFFFRPSGL